MDEAQAARIQRHLLAVSEAIHEAVAAMPGLTEEDRAIFVRPLAEFAGCLHFDLLDAIYARYPGLRPIREAEPPTIVSELRWQDVKLPASVSEADLDTIIFSMLTSHWQKTAMVVGKAAGRCKEHALPVDDEILAARLQALAESNRIEAIGDLRQWRHSEVKLKG